MSFDRLVGKKNIKYIGDNISFRASSNWNKDFLLELERLFI